MTVVVTMAGLGSRFRNAGYTQPKYRIEVRGKTLFEWSMLSLQGFFSVQRYIFIVRREDEAKEFIQEECLRLGIAPVVVVELDRLTSGQAETVMKARAYWEDDEPLLIYNIDTYVEPGYMNDAQLRGDGFIPCFCGEGDKWSFVQLDLDGKAIQVREKERISSNCTVGAYYFKTALLYCQLYQDYYESMPERKLDAGERYVAPLYNELIRIGGSVFISNIPVERVHVLGTPEEVDEFRKAEK